MSRRSIFAAVLGLSLSLGAAAFAADPVPTTEAAPATAAAPVGALQAFIDPATGALREPTDADLATTAAAHPIPLRSEVDLPVILHADGMMSVVLDAGFMSTSVAKIGPDGRMITGCVATREEYDAFFASTPAIAEGEVR